MRYLIIIPAAARQQCNDIALEHFDAVGGALTFSVPLFPASAQDDSTPSHYWCSAEVLQENIPLLLSLQPSIQGSLVEQYDLASQSGYPQQRLTQLGLRTAKPRLP
jgi:hypothetical protein